MTPSRGVVATAVVIAELAVPLAVVPAPTCMLVVTEPDLIFLNFQRFLQLEAPKPSFLKLAGAMAFIMFPILLMALMPLKSC